MYLNASIPLIRAFLRKEFLYDLEGHEGEFEDVYVFGVTSLAGRALGFSVMTPQGVLFSGLPIHAFIHDKKAPRMPLDYLQLWDCFSYELAVTEYSLLSGLRCEVILKNREWIPGRCLFTIDWCAGDTNQLDTSFSEIPAERKSAHIIELDNGCYAAQPNNRIRWHEPSFVTKPFPEYPDFRVSTREWKCETRGKWATEDSDRYFYETVDT